MIGAIVSAAAEVGAELWKLVSDAMQARAEQHAAILARLIEVGDQLRAVRAAFASDVAARDTETDTELEQLEKGQPK